MASRLSKTWKDIQKLWGIKFIREYLDAPQERDKTDTQSEKTWVLLYCPVLSMITI